jgi:hypothetical protein
MIAVAMKEVTVDANIQCIKIVRRQRSGTSMRVNQNTECPNEATAASTKESVTQST